MVGSMGGIYAALAILLLGGPHRGGVRTNRAKRIFKILLRHAHEQAEKSHLEEKRPIAA